MLYSGSRALSLRNCKLYVLIMNNSFRVRVGYCGERTCKKGNYNIWGFNKALFYIMFHPSILVPDNISEFPYFSAPKL